MVDIYILKGEGGRGGLLADVVRIFDQIGRVFNSIRAKSRLKINEFIERDAGRRLFFENATSEISFWRKYLAPIRIRQEDYCRNLAFETRITDIGPRTTILS